MTSLRIAIESGEAVRNADAAQDALRALGQAALQVEQQLAAVGRTRVDLGPDPLGVRAAVRSAEKALEDFAEAKRKAQFGAGLETPFGAGLGGGFTAAELGIARASEAAKQLGVDLRAATVIDPRGLAIIQAQEGGLRRAGAAAGQYGEAAQAAAARATTGFDVNLRSILRVGGAILGIRGIRALTNELVAFEQGLLDVSQATGLVGQPLEDVRRRVLALSSEIPVASAELLELAAAAGRLQIRTPEGIEEFVRSLGTLQAIAPGVAGTAAELGERVGTFLTQVGAAPTAVQPLVDVIARLDDEFGKSGTAIFATAEAVAQAGAGFIRSSADALGLGAAFAKIGVEGGEAASATAQVLTKVRNAISEGGRALSTITELTGKNAEELRKALRTDAAALFISVLEGLDRQGSETAASLDALGLASARQGKIIGPLIDNTQILTRGLQEARAAEIAGTAATDELAQQQATLGGQLAVTRNLFVAATSAAQDLTGSLTGAVKFGNDVAASLLGISVSGEQASDAAESVAAGLKAAAVVAAGALVVGKLQSAYAGVAAATLAANAALTASQGPLLGAATGVTALSVALTRARLAAIAFATSPAGIVIGVGAAVAGLVALDDALDEPEVKLRGLSAEFRKLAAAAGDSVDDVTAAQVALADLAGEVERFDLGKALQARGLEASNVEDQIRGIEQQVRAAEDAALKLRVLQEKGGGFARATEVEGLVPEAARATLHLDIDAIKSGVEQDLRSAFEALVREGRAGDAFQTVLDELARGATFRPKPGVDPEGFKEFAGLMRSAIEGAAEASHPEIPAEKLAQRFLEVFSSSFEVEGIPIDGIIADLEALGEAGVVNAERLRGALEQKPRTAALSDFFAEESKRITDAIAATELSIGKFRLPDLGTQAFADIGLTTVQPGAELRGFEAKRAAIAAERAEYEKLLQTKVAAGEVKEVRELPELRRLRDDLVAAKLDALEYAEALEKIGREQEAFGRASDLLGQRVQNMAQQGLGESAAAFDLLRRQVELTRLETLKGIEVKITEGVSQEEVDQRRKAADATRDLALENIGLRESSARLADVQHQLGIEQEFLGQASASLDRELQQLSARGLGESAEAFELMRRRAEAARIEALKGIEIRVGGDRKLDPAAIDALRKNADAVRDGELAYVDILEAASEAARAQHDLGVESDFLARRSGLLGQQLQLLGRVGLGESAEAFEIMRRQIRLTRQEAEKDIQAQDLDLGVSDEEIAGMTRFADAEQEAALAAVNLDERLARSARSARLLGSSARAGAGILTDALLGLRDPAEAARQAIAGIAQEFLAPRFEAEILKLTKLLGFSEDTVGQAAAQAGVLDLAPELAIDLAPLGVSAATAGGGVDALGVASFVSADALHVFDGALGAATASLFKLAAAASTSGGAQAGGAISSSIGSSIGSSSDPFIGGTGGGIGLTVDPTPRPPLAFGGPRAGGGQQRAANVSSQTINYTNNISVAGGRSPMESGLKVSLRQFERDIVNRSKRRI